MPNATTPNPIPGKMYALLPWPVTWTRPFSSKGGNGEPLAKMQRPWYIKCYYINKPPWNDINFFRPLSIFQIIGKTTLFIYNITHYTEHKLLFVRVRRVSNIVWLNLVIHGVLGFLHILPIINIIHINDRRLIYILHNFISLYS